MFLNSVIRRNRLPRNLILKIVPLWQSIMKINCYAMNLTYVKLDMMQWTVNCFTVIVAAIYTKIVCNIETFYFKSWNAFSVNTDFKYLFSVYWILDKTGLLVHMYIWQFWKVYLKVSNSVTKVGKRLSFQNCFDPLKLLQYFLSVILRNYL